MVGRKHAVYLGLCMVVMMFYSLKHDDHELERRNDSSISKSRSSSSTSSVHPANRNPNTRPNYDNSSYYYTGSQWIVNPWYGWQPETPTSMECSWQECAGKEQYNSTCTTCRDSVKDLAKDMPRVDIKDWIPDVTILRRMFVDGHDAQGNPWPPPLDDDLCQLLEERYPTRELLDIVPIVDAPIPTAPPDNNRVLTMIYTTEKKHATVLRAMRETWAPGLDGFLAFSTQSDPRIPAISIPHKGPEDYFNLWQKIRTMWKFVGKHYRMQFDWFFIAGDDVFVFPENLKGFLATYDSSQPHFLGKRFQAGKEIGFNSGGAGYAISRPALECLVSHLDDIRCEPGKRTYEDDWMTARCLAKACNISYEDTRDEQQRERFHHFYPDFEYSPERGELEWYKNFTEAVGGIKLGKDCCAPDTISFHYLKNPVLVRYLHHYVHNCKRNLAR